MDVSTAPRPSCPTKTLQKQRLEALSAFYHVIIVCLGDILGEWGRQGVLGGGRIEEPGRGLDVPMETAGKLTDVLWR